MSWREPIATRPHMPGYGVRSPHEGSGLLPWSWAEERLSDSRNYWVVTVWPDGRPHAMLVCGMWLEGRFWFSSSKPSRKARNLTADLGLKNTKYSTTYGMDILNPALNSAFRVRPRWVFGLREDDFTGSPTRWEFES